jgi:glycosyltransferase involved in cell wall biosynthesis
VVSRRGSASWALPRPDVEPVLEVLIPTAGRVTELAVTLAGLAAQDDPPFGVIVSDQSPEEPVTASAPVRALERTLLAQGRPVRIERHLPRRGVAEQRQFLLECSRAEFVLFLDDDVWLEPGMLARLHEAILALDCGFVGSAVQGLSFLADDRPHERRAFAPWDDGVRPERVRRGTAEFDRWPLHNAANLAHLAADLGLRDGQWRAYKVAWVGGCVLYRRSALVEAGGYDFWRRLPPEHAGEDVAAQWRVMERFGGAGIVPSGAVHLESATTVPVRDVEAHDVVFG